MHVCKRHPEHLLQPGLRLPHPQFATGGALCFACQQVPSTTTIREQLPGPPGPIRIPLHAPGSEDASPTATLLPGALFVTSCGCHAGRAPACNPSTCALGSPGSWSPLRVRVGASSKAFDMLMHAGPSLIRACRDKPTGCTLRATDRRNFPLAQVSARVPHFVAVESFAS